MNLDRRESFEKGTVLGDAGGCDGPCDVDGVAAVGENLKG